MFHPSSQMVVTRGATTITWRVVPGTREWRAFLAGKGLASEEELPSLYATNIDEMLAQVAELMEGNLPASYMEPPTKSAQANNPHPGIPHYRVFCENCP
ncbi:hypothetical protein ACWIG4_30315 [Streptomyces sp. NPDC002248]